MAQTNRFRASLVVGPRPSDYADLRGQPPVFDGNDLALKAIWTRGVEAVKGRVLDLWRRLRGSQLSPTGVAVSVGVGLAVGLVPLYGMHWALVLLVCLPLRLDSALAFAATMISNPITLPLLIAAEIELGALLLGGQFDFARAMAGEDLGGTMLQLAVGTTALASAVSSVGTLIVFRVVRARHRRALPKA